MTGVLVVTGTKREAAALRRSGWTVIAGGGDEARLRAELEAAARGAEAILSFGMAGALVDDLAIGDWVVADRVTGAVAAMCDAEWRDALAAALPGARVGGVYADGRMIAAAAEKRRLGERHRALAVDMESHVAAAVAAARGLPFAIARCVSDRAGRALPHAVTVAMRADGGVDVGAVLRSLAARPRQIGDLVRTTASFVSAMRALEQGGARLVTRPTLQRRLSS